jgi:hypothetical protein
MESPPRPTRYPADPDHPVSDSDPYAHLPPAGPACGPAPQPTPGRWVRLIRAAVGIVRWLIRVRSAR